MNLYADVPDEDITIVAELFQLARSGRFRNVEDLVSAASEGNPDVSEEQLKRCCKHLANILFKSDHGGYGDEYVRTKRSKRPAASR